MGLFWTRLKMAFMVARAVFRKVDGGNMVLKLIILPFDDADDELLADSTMDAVAAVLEGHAERRKARKKQRLALQEANNGQD